MNTPVNPLLDQGRTLAGQGKFAEAAATLRQLLESEPRNPQALSLLGLALAQMGRPQEAIEPLAAAARLQPNNPGLHVNLGNALSESGRPGEALAAYERALALAADLPAAHRGRGVALLRLGRAAEALEPLQRALRLMPQDAQSHNILGAAFERLGRHDEALEQFGHAVALNPYHLEALHNRAAIHLTRGNYPEALEHLERALALAPRHPALLANRGNALRALGRHAEALEAYDQALAQAPREPRLLLNRAVALIALRRPTEALAALDQALRSAPGDFDAHFHRGVALALLERPAEALASFERALAINPASAEAHNNRGAMLGRLNRDAEAVEAFAAAVAHMPEHLDAYVNAGHTLRGLGRFPAALAQFDAALARAPGHSGAEWGKSLLTLALGDFANGWPLYESRLRLERLREYQRELPMPRLAATDALAGRSILVHAEQGLGDTLQFCRYVPLLEARGARVSFEAQPELVPLLRSLPLRGTLLARGEPLPPADAHLPLLSLPLTLGGAPEALPAATAYLAPEEQAVQQWRARLAELPGLKVGLNWQGHVGAERQTWIRGRSYALAQAAALARVPGVTLISLQKGAAAAQRAAVDFGGALHELTDPADTGAAALMQTAALMRALDLVITSDTSVAHLAGALGVAVWVVLQKVPDWRWQLEREDSPWYPSMRLFRQQEANDWAELFARVARALQERVTGAKAPA